jgi:Phage integrase family
MRVFECQNSMTHAAAKIGMERITHHDLRQLFATICIESGVDIPTVSRWLGHNDGGALCMKTYASPWLLTIAIKSVAISAKIAVMSCWCVECG